MGCHTKRVAIEPRAAAAAFFAFTAVLRLANPGLPLSLAAALVSLVIAIFLMPRRTRSIADAAALPWWDIPARMVVATVFVVALTSAAPALGSRLAGLLSPFPLYATVLSVFAHRLQGAGAAIAVMRGLLLGLFAFTSFFLCVAALLVPAGIVVAFAGALAAALAVQTVSLVTGRALKIA